MLKKTHVVAEPTLLYASHVKLVLAFLDKAVLKLRVASEEKVSLAEPLYHLKVGSGRPCAEQVTRDGIFLSLTSIICVRVLIFVGATRKNKKREEL